MNAVEKHVFTKNTNENREPHKKVVKKTNLLV